ncbi:hypothetical protein G9F71_025195 [Clostridium sp. FP2]|uniref:hypothetical protein n=1 Tax=Clostridium sp. FP2 TaxID=2724481 RepID=UPI001CCB5D4B|nr:hypothetical protein [Clostridium sp. FP2]MBZ9626105.1 hypothetical protein [Clostridium sp. FP2]
MGLIRGSKYCDFSVTDDDVELSYKLWPIIKGIIMTNIENGQHIIIEECYLPPAHIRDFEPEYLEQKDCYDYMNRDNFIKLHSQIKELCRTNNAKFFEINNDYVGEMTNVHNWID